MLPLEVEVKFYIPDIDAFRHHLPSNGAIFKSKAEETNIRFENQDNMLFHHKSLLRLRQADVATLTFKSQPSEYNRDFKILHEVEVIVNDFFAMRQILESLGFHAAQIYEKTRETWMLENTTLCLDKMPFGSFIEIEGEPEKIRQTAIHLGLEWKDRIVYNYLEIFDVLKQQVDLPFSDVTFENFKNLHIDFKRYLHLFIAG